MSIVGTLDEQIGSASESPVERVGTIVLLANTTAHQPHSVRIRTEDSPDIAGEVCVQAQLLASSSPARISAEASYTAAGRAAHRHDWAAAFDDYLAAARIFDRLDMPRSAGSARHAMAELAYQRFDQKRNSYALAVEALANYGTRPGALLLGTVAALEARDLLDMPGADTRAIAPQVREILSIARQYDSTNPLGYRELPRLDILAGFLEYMSDAPDAAKKTHDLFERATEHCRELHDWDCHAIASQNLALLAEESDNFAVALQAYGNALRLLPRGLDPKTEADIWDNLGRLQGVAGLFSSSARSHATAMREYAALGDCPGLRRALAHSGNLLVQIGSLQDAQSSLLPAASRPCADLLTENIAPGKQSSWSHAALRLNLDESPRTAPLCGQPLEAGGLSTESKLTIFNSLLSLAEALNLQGELERAHHCLDLAARYAVTARTRMRLSNARGADLIAANDPTGARSYFDTSLQIADEAQIPSTNEHRGTAQLGIVKAVLMQGASEKSLGLSLEALAGSLDRGDIEQTVTALRLASASYLKLGRRIEAARSLETAADLIEAVPIDELDGEKRATFLASQHAAFAELTDIYATATNSHDPWVAFAAAERGRARSARYAIMQQVRDSALPLGAPPSAQYQQLLRDTVRFTKIHSSSDREQLIEYLDTAAQKQRATAEPLDRGGLMRSLQRLDATLVEYAVGSHEMFAFVVDVNDIHLMPLGERNEIELAAQRLRERLRDPESRASSVNSAAQSLAKLILWPLQKQLSSKRLIFVPDDALHTVPFSILPWSNTGANGSGLVIERAETAVAPSALFLTHNRSSELEHHATDMTDAIEHIELVGDPIFQIPDWIRKCVDERHRSDLQSTSLEPSSAWTQQLPPLPGSGEEIATVNQLIHKTRANSIIDTLVGCSAVASALRRAAQQPPDLLHIATHVRVDSQRPRLSSFALTPEVTDNELVTDFRLLDILGLKLNSRLVVLSACDSSSGRLLPGEGVLGPAQAFLAAGAASVLASYWRVDDTSTARFIQRFYEYLFVRHLPASAALRQAQLTDPAFSTSHDWAAFALYGLPNSSM